jgi:uncharacterized protein (TIGR03000 family)
MYSIVLLAAVTATPDAPQFNGYFRDAFRRDSNSCTGCTGCTGAVRYSCTGCTGTTASTTSCTGCTGCCGGSIFGWRLSERVRSWFSRDTSAYGCCGGRNCYNCTGASYTSGCCGTATFSCFGGPAYSYTPVFNGGLGYQGMTVPAPPPLFDTYPAPGVPGSPWAVPVPAPGTVGAKPANPPTVSLTGNGPTGRATVVVRLPADARLFADTRALTLTGAERKFVSPELPVDQEFVYRFKAEYERDGETVSVTKKVTVRAGATVAIEFTDLTAARPATNPSTTTGITSTVTSATGLDKGSIPAVKTNAQQPVKTEPVKTEPPIKPAPGPVNDAPTPPVGDRAMITVKLPPGATLYVDDRKSPSLDPVRSFSTPQLVNGREYGYLLKAEIIRNGQPETLTQKVQFRAGERVIVDFTSLGK